LTGVIAGKKTKEKMDKQEKRGLSNFIPLVPQYRLGRRVATSSGYKKSKEKK